MPSFNPFISQDMPADGGVSERKLGLRTTTKSSTRPLGDVKAFNPVFVRFVAASDALEVSVTSPVALADMSTPWAPLTCMVRLDLPDDHALRLSHVSQGIGLLEVISGETHGTGTGTG